MTQDEDDINAVKLLYAERAALWEQEKQIKNKIKEIKLRYIKRNKGLGVGCLIKTKDSKIYKVVNIETWDMDMSAHQIKAVPKRKDGTFGTAIRNIWVYQDEVSVIEGAP